MHNVPPLQSCPQVFVHGDINRFTYPAGEKRILCKENSYMISAVLHGQLDYNVSNSDCFYVECKLNSWMKLCSFRHEKKGNDRIDFLLLSRGNSARPVLWHRITNHTRFHFDQPIVKSSHPSVLQNEKIASCSLHVAVKRFQIKIAWIASVTADSHSAAFVVVRFRENYIQTWFV